VLDQFQRRCATRLCGVGRQTAPREKLLNYLGAYFDTLLPTRASSVVQGEWIRYRHRPGRPDERVAKSYFQPIYQKAR